ncbi:isocitrate lyase/PEP mutase family protein [Aeromicrobium sp.]|uniref:isocitrate lyase/PEP mutase family protein n=1 Tax=Aeromicrobium sp. TaxID=1871063 RepID=UPI003D6A87C7
MPTTQDKAATLRRLHAPPAMLRLVNVWDVTSARVVANVPGVQALATASHSIAASLGFEDGEHISRGAMLDVVQRVVAATELPVTADLEAGYGDPAETTRHAIGVGAVGMNLEDRMDPLPEAVAAVEAVIKAAVDEGLSDFVLNARTDAFLLAGDRPRADVLGDAVQRGQAFLDVGAPVVFVPGGVSEHETTTLVDAFGPGRLSLLAVPGGVQPARMAELGVARVSFGPFSQSVALMALQDLATSVAGGGGLPADFRSLS